MDLEEFELELIDHGLEEIFEAEDNQLTIQVAFDSFGSMQKFLEQKNIEVLSAAAERLPLTTVTLTPEEEADVLKVIHLLEEDEDVQHVYHNMVLSEEETES